MESDLKITSIFIVGKKVGLEKRKSELPVFENIFNPYQRSRKSVYAKNGMVATSQTAAAQAGLEILKKGGNAIDAAVATAACLTVVEPTSNGIGSDAFAIIDFKGKLAGLNSSGPAPKLLSKKFLGAQGLTKMPTFGWYPIDIPGTPAAWATLINRFGRLSLLEDLQPAIHYAEDGFVVTQVLADLWKRAFVRYQQAELADQHFAAAFREWRRIFTNNGKTPMPGEIWRLPDLAKTLVKIGATNAETFYSGEIAQKIVEAAQKFGGLIEKNDLKNFHSAWVEPLKINYHGYDVFELPPNSQGIVALEALGILNKYSFNQRADFDTVHKQIEAIKLSFNDLLKYTGDPNRMTIDPTKLLSAAHLLTQQNLIDKNPLNSTIDQAESGGTVYLCTADKDENMVSYIQSCYMGFGSGVVIPQTGVAMNNRANNFSLTETSPNFLCGGFRPINTIIPGFLKKNGTTIGPFGVMGGFMQPQGHVQVLMNCIDFGLDPQGALDAPRWQWVKENEVIFEQGFSKDLLDHLGNIGYKVLADPGTNIFGRGQIIWRNHQNGIYVGGSESRTDGAVAAW